MNKLTDTIIADLRRMIDEVATSETGSTVIVLVAKERETKVEVGTLAFGTSEDIGILLARGIKVIASRMDKARNNPDETNCIIPHSKPNPHLH